MAYFNEAPHTRNYDDDLRELIVRYKTLGKEYKDLLNIYNHIKDQIGDITIEQLQEWLDDGTLENIINKALLRDKVFYTSDYCTPDGNTDNTADLQRAIDESEGYTLVFDYAGGQPYRTNQLVMKSKTKYKMDTQTIIKANDTFISDGRWQDPLIDFRMVHDSSFDGRGGTITMNKPATLVTEHAHCMGVRGSKNITVENVNLTYASGDGFYVDQYDGDKNNTAPENVFINNIHCLHNGRQGLSLVSGKNIVIRNSEFSNTSGKAPQSGLDIEPELRSTHCDVTIENCVFNDNQYAGLLISLGTTSDTCDVNIVVNDCTVLHNNYGVMVMGCSQTIKDNGSIKISGCYIDSPTRNGIIDIWNNNQSLPRMYSNCIVHNANKGNIAQNADTVGDVGYGCAFHVSAENDTNGNVTFNNCKAISDDSLCKSAFGFSLKGTGSIDGVDILDCSQKGIAQSFVASTALVRNTYITGLEKPVYNGYGTTYTVDTKNYYQRFQNGTMILGEFHNVKGSIEFENRGGASTIMQKGSGVHIYPNDANVTLNQIGSRVEVESTNGFDYYVKNSLKTSLDS